MAPEAARSRRPSRLRKAALQLLAVCALLAAAEGLAALCGVRPLADVRDPFVGFAGHAPLFEEGPGPDGTPWMTTAPGKLKWFNRQSFPRTKPPGTKRVFMLGGSAVYGHPYDDRVSFSGWLREMLPAADPSTRWEVVNCGGISYASYREAVVLDEIAQYQPDAIVLYSGPNEFLEERTYPGLAESGGPLLEIGAFLARTRLFTLARRALDALRTGPGDNGRAVATGAAGDDGSRTPRTILPAEVSTILDRPAGLDHYTRDDALRDRVLEHFRRNLERMAARAREAGAAFVLVAPASELRDCAPFKSEHTDGLTAAQRAANEQLADRGERLLAPPVEAGGATGAVALLEPLATTDPRWARGRYVLGEALFAAGRMAEAREQFVAARDEDVCPLRPLTPMRAIVRDVAAAQGATFVDFVAVVGDECERRFGHRIPGHEQFLDHVHLDIDGYRLLALALLDALARAGVAHPVAGWEQSALPAVDATVAARLDPATRGLALRNLAKTLGWAGRIDEARRLAHQTLDVLGPGDSESHFLLGTFALQEGRPDEAAREFTAATTIDPGYAEAWMNLADAQLSLGDRDSALAALDRVVALAPTLAQAHGIRGLLLDGAGRHEEALAELDRAVELAPDDARVWNNRATVEARAGHADRAEADWRRAVELDPGYARAWANLGRLSQHQGRTREAVEQLERALALDPGYEEARRWLEEARRIAPPP